MSQLHKYKWLLFDLDNTLIDFHKPSLASFADLCAAAGISYTDRTYRQYQLVNKDVWDRYESGRITSTELKTLRFELFFKQQGSTFDPVVAHHEYTAGLVKYSKADDKVRLLLSQLQERHHLAIITNGLKEAQRPRLLHTGISDYFQHIIVSDEIGYAKPQAAFFDHVMDVIQHHDRSDLLIIGDSLTSDIKGGNDSKIDTVWYNPLGLPLHSSIKPAYTIAKLADLLTID